MWALDLYGIEQLLCDSSRNSVFLRGTLNETLAA